MMKRDPMRNSASPASPEAILEELKKLYWNAVHNEVQNMIKFHNVLKTANYQPYTPSSLECDNFKKMFNIWIRSQPNSKQDSASRLYHASLQKAQEHLDEPIDNDHRLARLILQSSSKLFSAYLLQNQLLNREGLLDIDILYEPTQLSQRYLNVQQNLPNVEHIDTDNENESTTTGPRFYGISCFACEALIRSNVFYECVEGCRTSIQYEYTQLGWRKYDFKRPDPLSSLQSCRYRLCAPCKNIIKSCQQGHPLNLVHYKDQYFPGLRGIRAELDKFETETEPESSNEHEKDNRINEDSETDDETQILKEDYTKENCENYGDTEADEGDEKQYSKDQATTKRSWQEKLAMKILTSTKADGSAAQLALRTAALMLKGHLAPAGNFHLSFMFGPLIFESGLPKINHGILVSPRPVPSLLTQSTEETETVECPFFYKNKYTQRLEYQHKDIPVKQRTLLACVKRVYGGAFSGYPEPTRIHQTKVIGLLVKEANVYGRIPDSKSAKVKGKQLSAAASRIKGALEEYIGLEVNKHLSRIARILVESKTIRGWNMFTNSCQWLVMRLLSGPDFDYIIPQFPDNLGKSHGGKPEEVKFDWPQYLISFGAVIEGFGQTFYQPNSMITDFCQSRPTIDYDIIEYISLRSRESPNGLPISQVELSLSGHKAADDATMSMDALWAMPGDTLSMLQFHLLRQPSKYQNSDTLGCLSEDNWNRNRFQVMQMLDIFASLLGALGVSLFDLLSRNRQLVSRIIIPSARVFGNILASEAVRIIRLSSRWVAYDITDRVPTAMGEAKELRRQLQKASGATGDPVHGEEVLSGIVEFFLTPLALVAGRTAVNNLGQVFRIHKRGPWLTLNGYGHTLVCPMFVKKISSMRK